MYKEFNSLKQKNRWETTETTGVKKWNKKRNLFGIKKSKRPTIKESMRGEARK